MEGACEDNYCREAACGCGVAVIPIVVVLMTPPQELERRGGMAERVREGGREDSLAGICRRVSRHMTFSCLTGEHIIS